jgi:ketosteroid isomerase-like protein
MPATGKQVATDVIDINRIADGQIAERRGLANTLGPLQQLGALPTPGAPS